MDQKTTQSGDVKRALVHIGTTKTGSTAIQESFARASKANLLGDIEYPLLVGHKSAVRTNHNFFRVLYRPISELTRTYRAAYSGPTGSEDRARDTLAFRAGLAEAVARKDKLVLSGEFMTTFTTEEIKAFDAEMATLGVAEVTPVIYIRDPVDRYISSVQQRIKASSTFPAPWKYRDGTIECIHRWRDIYPNLIVRPFDRSMLREGDVVADFVSVASNHFGTDLSKKVQGVNSNESLSAEGMIILQNYRAAFHKMSDDVFKADSSAIIRLLLQSRKHIPQTRARLNDASASILEVNHKEFFRILRTEFGISYRTKATPPPRPAPLNGGDVAVADILASYDPEVVHDLMLWLLNRSLIKKTR